MKNIIIIILGLLLSLSGFSQGRQEFFPFRRYSDFPGTNPHITTKTIDLTITSIYEDNNGCIWLGGLGAYAYYKNGIFTNYRHNQINTVIPNDTAILLGTQFSGIGIIKRDFTIHYMYLSYPLSNAVKSLLYDKDKNLWCGTDRSLGKFENNSWKSIFGDMSTSYLALFQDSKGHIWVGTNRGQILRFDGTYWETFRAGEATQSIVEDKDNNILFGTSNGIYKYADGNMKLFYSTRNTDLPSDQISTLCVDKYNNIWIGRYEGLSIIVNSNKQVINFSLASAMNGSVSSIIESKDGCILIGTESIFGGFTILEPLVVSYNYSKCSEGNSGFIAVNSCHLTPPLQYSIDNGVTFQSDSIFKNLTEGFYNVAVKNNSDTIYYGKQIELKEKLPKLGNDGTFLAGVKLTLNPGNGFSSYLWSTGETTNTIEVDSTGVGIGTKKISVIVENNGCIYTDSIKITFIKPVNLFNVKKDEISICPNPVKYVLTIDATVGFEYNYFIYDMLGTILIKGVFRDKIGIDVNNLKTGIYHLKISDNKNTIITKKLIKI